MEILIGIVIIALSFWWMMGQFKKPQQQADTSRQQAQPGKQNDSESQPVVSKKPVSPEGRKRAIKHGLRVSIQPGERYTIEDMLKQFDCFDSETTPQEIRDCLTDLGEYGTKEVVQEEIEGKTYYSFPSGSTPTHLTPVQEANEILKRRILDDMESGKRYTIGDMLANFDCFEPGFSPQRVSSLLSQLGARGTGEIVRTEEKGKAYFSLAKNKENERMKRGILANMKKGERYTIGDMLASFDCFEPNTGPQKVSALLSQLGARGTGEIVRTEEKGKAYFSLADKSQRGKQTSPPPTRQYSSGSPSTNTSRCSPPSYTSSSPSYSSPSYVPYPSGNQSSSDDEYDDPVHYNYFQNGPTDHWTFVGNCKCCGGVWEFENYEVVPVPYPHGTCPNCHQWVAVF